MRKPASNMRELDSASGKTPEFVSGRGLVSKRQRFSLTSTWEEDVEETPEFVHVVLQRRARQQQPVHVSSSLGLVRKRQRFSLSSTCASSASGAQRVQEACFRF